MRVWSPPRGSSRRMASGLLACAIVWVPAVAVAVPPPPPNPSDDDLASADAQVEADRGAVGSLINQVVTAEQRLLELDSEMAGKREAANKALVDLQEARAAADAAAAVTNGARQELSTADDDVARAHERFDQFAVAAYMQPGVGSMPDLLAGASAERARDRAQVLSQVSTSQRDALEWLQRAQLTQGNRVSAARAAEAAAVAAARTADQKKGEAVAAVAAVAATQQDQARRRQQLVAQRDAAQQQLDFARERDAGLRGQRDAYVAWDQQRLAEQAAQEQAAADKARADQEANSRAADLGGGHRPHTQLQDSPPPRAGLVVPPRPHGNRAELIETVADRALSQIGVIYAWGGGDETGPTEGIHDGGVADSHGDYAKVGFDCSGLMVYAFAGIGISLPHYSGYQYQLGTRVPVAQRERGDMLFWGRGGSEHVALYLGDDQMVEAPESGEVVQVSAVRDAGMMPYAVRLIT